MNTFKILQNLCSSLVVLAVLTALCMVIPMGCSRSTPPIMKCDSKALYTTIETLCSDSLGGRRAGSGNDLRAAHFLETELNTIGCVPLWNKALVPFNIDSIAKSRGFKRVLAGGWCDSSFNVVMTIRSRYPDAKKVILGAHYDHLGLFKANKGVRHAAGDMLYGANDNASGTAAVIEIARLLKPYANDFKHDLIIAIFGAEEMGLIGSRHLERMLRDSLIVVGHMVNLEMLGRMRGDTLLLQGAMLSPIKRVVNATDNSDSLHIELSKKFSIGSDHVSFSSKMIPISLFTTTDVSTQHTVNDIPESLDMKSMERAVNYITRYVYTLLTSDQLPKLQDNTRGY